LIVVLKIVPLLTASELGRIKHFLCLLYERDQPIE